MESLESALDVYLAAQALVAGELVAFPTETVYGLGANARDLSALAKLFEVKGRPMTHPVIVHIAPEADPMAWVAQGELTSSARALIEAFWPGPLTLILKRAERVLAAVAGGQTSVGLRCPSHPIAQSLLRAFAEISKCPSGLSGIAAPSANRFGHISPTTPQHVRDEFGEMVRILEGGACEVGIESTIVDVSRHYPVLLRPGQITAVQLAEVLGDFPLLPKNDAETPRAPGLLKRHYAPRIPLCLDEAKALASALAIRAPDEYSALLVRHPNSWKAYANVHIVEAPADAHDFAHALYRLLRELEQSGAHRIFVERPPMAPEWAGVYDRLFRASAPHTDRE